MNPNIYSSIPHFPPLPPPHIIQFPGNSFQPNVQIPVPNAANTPSVNQESQKFSQYAYYGYYAAIPPPPLEFLNETSNITRKRKRKNSSSSSASYASQSSDSSCNIKVKHCVKPVKEKLSDYFKKALVTKKYKNILAKKSSKQARSKSQHLENEVSSFYQSMQLKLKRMEFDQRPPLNLNSQRKFVSSTAAEIFYQPINCTFLTNATDLHKKLKTSFQYFITYTSRKKQCPPNPKIESKYRELHARRMVLNKTHLTVDPNSTKSESVEEEEDEILDDEAFLENGLSFKEVLKQLQSTNETPLNSKTKKLRDENCTTVTKRKGVWRRELLAQDAEDWNEFINEMLKDEDRDIQPDGADDDLVTVQKEWVETVQSDTRLLDPKLFPNEPGKMNDLMACSCFGKYKDEGPHHNIFPGEMSYPKCDEDSNCITSLHHYRIVCKPFQHFMLDLPTSISYDNHYFDFDGFSIFAHESLDKIPPHCFKRRNCDYSIELSKEPPPLNFCIQDLKLLSQYVFNNILEFVDFSLKGSDYGCDLFHILPRFMRKTLDGGVEMLSTNVILKYLINSFKPIPSEVIESMDNEALDDFNSEKSIKNQIALFPGKKPASIRMDLIDNKSAKYKNQIKAVIVHHTLLPHEICFHSDQKYIKLRKLHSAFSKKQAQFYFNQSVEYAAYERDKNLLEEAMKVVCSNKYPNDIIEVPCEGGYFTGVRSDLCQHAIHIPRIIFHIRRHLAIVRLCAKFDYIIRDPFNFDVVFTHRGATNSVYHGVNTSHLRNSRLRVGFNYLTINDLPDYMMTGKSSIKKHGNGLEHSRKLFQKKATSSNDNYERMEFYGDAIIEMIVSTRLYFLLPHCSETFLSLFRASLVSNYTFRKLSELHGLDKHVIVSHAPVNCLSRSRVKFYADVLESFIAAIYIDSGGLAEADRIFSIMLWAEEEDRNNWMAVVKDPLQDEFPNGDRHLMHMSPMLKKLGSLEESLGLNFRHIRLLAKALCPPSFNYTFLTRGNNQRMEWLGDTIMKFLVSHFVYNHLPLEHENIYHLIRIAIVNRFDQAEVARELTLPKYTLNELWIELTAAETQRNAVAFPEAPPVTAKQHADLLEAFLAAVFIDQGLEMCHSIFKVLIFPKLFRIIGNFNLMTMTTVLSCAVQAFKKFANVRNCEDFTINYKTMKMSENSVTVALFINNKMLSEETALTFMKAKIKACKSGILSLQGVAPSVFVRRFSTRPLTHR